MPSSEQVGEPDPSMWLRQLVLRGFQLMPPVRDGTGELEALIYVRPHGDVIDIVEVLAEDHVRAARVPRRGEIRTDDNAAYWRTTGNVVDVVDEVLALPKPLIRA
ncbi:MULTISPECIES: hypothetical protein [Saccharopolyspora]|uniref:Uncharacterized protein n=2 Tax=Saccharopolyspora TaxID=1835 RepID=A0A4R4VBL3_9PSEU|nr:MULTISPECIES: hypothetical protein [Saccharopolyspora]MBQ0923682.1 hypothetical protein [Saccharopolyspora endophytica]TDD00897.1 hypothetical protein E1181_26545 [Saccharopolyspora terrae]